MPALYRLAVVAVLLLGGCDYDRISKLEKQNQELLAEVKKDRAVADYDLQAKCARDSKVWFNENWRADKDTVLLTYSNHYNKSQNKCFIEIEYHFSVHPPPSWVNDMEIWDIYENTKYGDISVRTMVTKPEYHSEES